MKGTYRGPMALQDLYQAFYQDREFFLKHSILYIKNATLYFNPCDEFGKDLLITDSIGKEVLGYTSAGAYKSAADLLDPHSLEATSVISRQEIKKDFRF